MRSRCERRGLVQLRRGRARRARAIGEHAPLTFDHDAVGELAHAHRSAEVQQAVDVRALGGRTDRPRRSSRTAPARRGSRQRRRRPGAGARARGEGTRRVRPRRRAAGSSASARGTARSRGGGAQNVARVGADRLDLQPRPVARSRERREQQRVEVERRHRVAGRARSSATRPVPAPTSSIRPRARCGELAPQPQVGAVAAALEVVPHDGTGAVARGGAPSLCARVAQDHELLTLPARDEQLAQREHRRVRRQRVQRRLAVGPIGRRPLERRAQVWLDADARGVDARVLHAHGQLGGAAAAAREATDAAREQLEVGVPDPRDVATVGDLVVEHAQHVVLARLQRERAQHLVRAGGVLDEQDAQLARSLRRRPRLCPRRMCGAQRDRLGAAEGGSACPAAPRRCSRAEPSAPSRARRRRARCRRCTGPAARAAPVALPSGACRVKLAARTPSSATSLALTAGAGRRWPQLAQW